MTVAHTLKDQCAKLLTNTTNNQYFKHKSLTTTSNRDV